MEELTNKVSTIEVDNLFHIPEDYTGIVHVNSKRLDMQVATRWYLDGHLHREDGPAVVEITGDEFWCLYGLYITKQEHERVVERIKEISDFGEWLVSSLEENYDDIISVELVTTHALQKFHFLITVPLSKKEIFQSPYSIFWGIPVLVKFA